METNEPLVVTEVSPGYWRCAFDNPPVNALDARTVKALHRLLTRLEGDPTAKVVVFDSADPDFFIAHFDMLGDPGYFLEDQGNGLHAWPDFTTRLAALPVLSVSVLRGRARGVGSEFLLATDLRFASKENAVLHQPELGMGVLPGGGALERLPSLVGRSRALEIVMASDAFDADIAERYGWVNRSVPDAELDDFVEKLAQRVASFDAAVLREAKLLINARAGLPDPDDLMASEAAFFRTVQYEKTQATWAEMRQHGLQEKSDLELNMADYFDRRAAQDSLQ
jgi:enoyl-CoA hydratase/carnithine racemase